MTSSTKRISTGTSVYLLPLRNPVFVAKQVAFIQRAFARSLILGIGVGWRENEFQSIGIDFAKRGEIADESIEILRMAWKTGSVSFSGNHFKIEKLDLGAKISPQPQVWIGGNSKRAIERAAKFGNGWIPTDFSLEEYRKNIPFLANRLKNHGRSSLDFMVASHLLLLLDRDRKEAERRSRIVAKRFGEEPSSIRKWALVGSSKEVLDRISSYSEAGVRYHVLSVWHLHDMERIKVVLDIFAREVLPSL
jgi:alkanesulfonate monooxygenase SsuD/methylene tetrahydromethanopterin reductase-like flavin-dependent oxidoreductase (luciferase family)